jgi:hypothetical protein
MVGRKTDEASRRREPFPMIRGLYGETADGTRFPDGVGPG